MTAALVRMTHLPTAMEADREALRAEDRTLTDGKLRFARHFYAARQKWGMLHPQASDRQFILWYLHPGAYNGSFQNYLDAGLAQARGFTDADWRFGDVYAAGAALRDRVTPEVIRQRKAEGLPIRPPKKEVTTIQIPSALGPAIRAARDAVSESDGLNGPEALGRVVMSYAAQPEIVRDGIRGADSTGEKLLPAMYDAVERRRDYRPLLKAQPCIRCGATSGIELHHQQTEADDRHRTHNFFVPLCRACHQARPGDDTSIHAQKFEDVRQDADYWRKAYRAMAISAEASRPEKENATMTPQTEAEPQENE